eukprot:6472626-Amphidinium_carterae.1
MAFLLTHASSLATLCFGRWSTIGVMLGFVLGCHLFGQVLLLCLPPSCFIWLAWLPVLWLGHCLAPLGTCLLSACVCPCCSWLRRPVCMCALLAYACSLLPVVGGAHMQASSCRQAFTSLSECLSDTQTNSPITWLCGYRGIRVGEAAHPGPPQPAPPPGGPRYRLGRKQHLHDPQA